MMGADPGQTISVDPFPYCIGEPFFSAADEHLHHRNASDQCPLMSIPLYMQAARDLFAFILSWRIDLT